jgi:L-ascorbate metabolism protein UlaG (beta-lactamase superfamily)
VRGSSRASSTWTSRRRSPGSTSQPFTRSTTWWGAVGFVVRCGPWTLYHSGDTVAYAGLGERLRRFAPDIALLPINGRLGNMDGREAAGVAKEARAGLAIPCHFEMFEFNTASPDEFVDACARLAQPYRILRAGERLTVPSA